ncbi:glycoside hydrolase family 29 protein [Rhodocollybia butyracea]|uniref:alpha-L-fucosidase n=1 Tax=Rhodocollybia butyracea TaxID=206335 RepID=A0A9P5Q860_9AGAR|nr:glycoside hydrolase family 29 protein [Rhodocollybia butyracea]
MMLAQLVIALPVLLSTSSIAVDLPQFPFTLLPLQPLFDNQAASVNGSVADFDGAGNSFDGQFLPVGGFESDGVTYELPASWGSGNDNVITNNQILMLPENTFVHELHALYSGDSHSDNSVTANNFIANFVDNSTQVLTLEANNWWGWPLLNLGLIQSPYSLEENGGKNLNQTSIFQWSVAVSSEKQLKSITLPPENNGARLHLFSVAFSPSSTSTTDSPALVIRRAVFSSRWELVNGTRAQAVQVTVANLLPASVFSANTSINSKHTIEISGSGITTLAPGALNRLTPGDQARVDVLITGATSGSNATIVIRNANGDVVGQSTGWPATALVENYSADVASLSAHETPTWWRKAKYGIFIHWGVYSYPAWAPPTSYAEWYNYDLHNPPNSSNPTWVHHLETYGPNIIYDDFISNFTASKFNASAWVDLFDRAGAKYFVQVTKHHDGFALFDTGNTTRRSSVNFGPKRNLLKELFDTAAIEKPNLHRGTYYSLPEWFNPDYAKYGFGQWPGGLARNPFNTTPTIEPYTGHLNISDYIQDLQLPHMLTLATDYNTEIMWCDIGGPNMTLEFAAEFYNHALANNYQVTLNNRCGAVPDFLTPEYATFNSIQTSSWESNEGMDPFSYGLDSATNASEYKNGTTIIQTLVDIVSKGGNFLLDVGPTAEGEVIAPMADNLLDAGSWLAYAGDCVYDTVSCGWSCSCSLHHDPTSFCIVAFDAPTDGQLIIHKRLPLLPGDDIVLLSPNGSQNSLPWSTDSMGNLIVNVSASAVSEVEYAWAFKATYKLSQ